jgi:hypothetical protein
MAKFLCQVYLPCGLMMSSSVTFVVVTLPFTIEEVQFEGGDAIVFILLGIKGLRPMMYNFLL